jgi:hypothetical protein
MQQPSLNLVQFDHHHSQVDYPHEPPAANKPCCSANAQAKLTTQLHQMHTCMNGLCAMSASPFPSSRKGVSHKPLYRGQAASALYPPPLMFVAGLALQGVEPYPLVTSCPADPPPQP